MFVALLFISVLIIQLYTPAYLYRKPWLSNWKSELKPLADQKFGRIMWTQIEIAEMMKSNKSANVKLQIISTRVVNLVSWAIWASWADDFSSAQLRVFQIRSSSAKLSVFEEGDLSWASWAAEISSAQDFSDQVQLSSAKFWYGPAQLSKIFNQSSSAQLSSTKTLQIYNSDFNGQILYLKYPRVKCVNSHESRRKAVAKLRTCF